MTKEELEALAKLEAEATAANQAFDAVSGDLTRTSNLLMHAAISATQSFHDKLHEKPEELIALAGEALASRWVRIDESDEATFPDDGDWVLGFRPGPNFFVCMIEDDEGGGCWFGEDGPLQADEHPSHWMPLPSPPKPEVP